MDELSSTNLAPPRALTPVAPQQRMLLLDVLRGFALFGVLWSNLNDWYGTTEAVTGLQRALAWTQAGLIEQRFYTLLGLLFGMGFAIQLTRAEQRGADVRGMFCRRMLVLLGIGVVHGLLFGHDVLTQYALIGFLLLPFRRLSPRRLLVAAAATLVLGGLAVALTLRVSGFQFIARTPDRELVSIYTQGDLAQIVAQNARNYLWYYRNWLFVFLPEFLTLFLLGMWAVRVNLLQRLIARRRLLVWILLGSVAVRIVGVLFTNLSVVVAYAAGLTLLVSYTGWARRLEPLAAVGRMPLTTYLTQSIISAGLFYHWGFGLYGRVGFDGMLGIAVIVFALQMAASVWWLRRYRFGPMEWLWRSVAYAAAQPMRQEALNLTRPTACRLP